MAITAAGIGSGIDVNGIVSQLMQLERLPVNALESRSRQYDAQLSAYGRLRSAVSTFESAMEKLGTLDKFKVYSSLSSDESVATATSDSNAAAGSYNIEVTRLAQNHRMGSDLIGSTDSFRGDLEISVDGNTLTVDTTGMTLSGVRDAINSDPNNPGVTATIINADGGQHLLLNADESGEAKSISVVDQTRVNNRRNVLNLATKNTDENGVLITTAELDAIYNFAGYDLTSASNTVSGVVDGLTLELTGLGSSTISLERDTESINESVNEMVDAYNTLQTTLTDLSQGELAGDSTVGRIQSQLRNVLNTPAAGLTGAFSTLAEIGILSDARTGELSVNDTDLENALDADFQSVAELFANDNQGYAFRFEAFADTLQDSDNVLDIREDTLRGQIDDIDDRVADWERRLELKEISLRAKFAALDALIGDLQSTGNFLLANLV